MTDTDKLIRHARERIDLCRATESKFAQAQAAAERLRADRGAPVYVDAPQAVVEAETERRVWQRVLDLLGVKQEPMSEEMRHAAAEALRREMSR